MELTKKNIKKLAKESNSNLTKIVCDFILERWDDYDDKKLIITEVLNYGCSGGAVPNLIYYDDIDAFYKKNCDEINNLLYYVMESLGTYNFNDIFTDWDDEDPLALNNYNRINLAWFAFEETMRNIAYKFEELEDLI